MDKVTRRELKSDHFKLEVEHGVEFVTGHRNQFIQWGSIAAALLLLIIGVSWYRSSQHQARQAALGNAMEVLNATIGPSQSEYQLTYPSQADKDQAIIKAFTDIATKYEGTEEGIIAEYYLGAQAADKGDMAQAQKRFELVANSSQKSFASLAKLALAQIYQSEGKLTDAEKLVRSVMDNPTTLVSRDEATIVLARLLTPSNPAEARKLLEPLRASQRSAISRAALTALGDISQK